MGTMLASLLRLQSIEGKLARVRQRLKSRQKAVATQQMRIDQFRDDWNVLHEKSLTRRQEADSLELDLKDKEAQVSKYRTALNTARTNKEYAGILTQINSLKADNAKLEDRILKIMQEADSVHAEADEVRARIETEEKRLEEIHRISAEEIEKLEAMVNELSASRAEAAADVPPKALVVFDRIAENYDGEAMAAIEIHGRKPPHEYVCGGCFMSLNPEHANALRTRDEVRTCDNCGRILYLEPQAEGSPTS
ncbi:MAG: C4-type zinc ribbon domain-containing protein [Planctomycetota bacterium]|nr:C4-type zinc ribbon domain-containing protein [Planctomycetota bacterium]